MKTTPKLNQRGIGHILLLIGFVVVIGIIVFSLNMVRKANDKGNNSATASTTNPGGQNMGNPDSLDPVQKGLASTNGRCTGTGSVKMAYAPMAVKDIGT